MSVADLIPTIQALPRKDKEALFQLLKQELEQSNDVEPILVAGEYPVWSPIDAHEAAAVLLNVLKNKPVSFEP